MRFQGAIALALPVTLLASTVTAVPSFPPQVPLQEYSSPREVPPTHNVESRIWGISHRIVETFWKQDDRRVPEQKKPVRKPQPKQLPTNTIEKYGGDVVLRFNVSTAEEVKSLAEASDTLLLDIWEFTAEWVDVRLAMELVPSLLGLLPSSLQHSHVPLLRERDLAQAIYDTYPTPRGAMAPENTTPPQPAHRAFGPSLQLGAESGPETNIFFADYQPLSVIQPWMRLMSSLFPTHTRLISLGLSAEGRDIPAFRIGVHPTNDEDPEQPRRKTILIVGGSHAREWISTSTVNYIAYGLITSYGKNAPITSMLEAFDFVLVPTLNPDGYVYTWETDRLWRKSRQSTSLRFCPGLDLDHSFGFEWHGTATQSNPCSEAYAGEQPFDAVESQRLSTWAKNETEHNNVELVGFLDLHSYSQQILYPYSYACDAIPPGLEDLEELAAGLSKAIRLSHGRAYESLPACEGNSVAGSGEILPRIEQSGGSALDFFYHELRVRYAYQIKLRDRGSYGFLLPKEHIVPTGKEILDSVLYLGSFLQNVYSLGGTEADQSESNEQPIELMEAVSDEDDVVDRSNETGQDESEAEWIVVEDMSPEDVQWELKRRRRR